MGDNVREARKRAVPFLFGGVFACAVEEHAGAARRAVLLCGRVTRAHRLLQVLKRRVTEVGGLTEDERLVGLLEAGEIPEVPDGACSFASEDLAMK